MHQNKKNQISFKLDLSKCKNEEQDTDNFDFLGGDAPEDEDDEDNFDIPGLLHVKVTDDSFRQNLQASKRGQASTRRQ